jgi:hypothetical protein
MLKVVRDIEIDESELIGENEKSTSTQQQQQQQQINVDCPIKYTFCKFFLHLFFCLN